jgi:hypothetical protein
MFKLTLIKSDQSNRFDITPITGKIEWESDFSLLATLDFDVAFSDTKLFPKNPCDVGDHVILSKEKEEIFRGVIVNEERNGRGSIKYNAFDYTWYLGRSKTIYQFNGISATQAVTKVLDDFGISVGSIINMPTLIDKIYIQESPAHILNDIIGFVEKHEGYRVNGEMKQGKLYLQKRKDLLISGRFRLAENLGERDIIHTISEPTRSRSIEEMRNRIRLIIEDQETDYIVTAEKQSDQLIKQYGLLEETLTIDIEDSAKSREVARILLERLGRVHETNNIQLMGDIRFKAGRLFDVVEPVTGMNGRFMISEAKHIVENGAHTMDLELVLPSEVD